MFTLGNQRLLNNSQLIWNKNRNMPISINKRA